MTNDPSLIQVRLPIYWASYIANNVKDSLEDGEEHLIKNTLDLIGVKREHNADVLDDGFFSDPVEEIITSHLSDYVDHTKRVQMRIDDLYNG